MEFEITSDQRTGKPIACRVVRLEAGSVSFEVCSPSVFDCLCLLVVQLYISQPHIEQKVKYSVYVDSFTFFHFLHAGMTMDNRRQKLFILLNTPHPNVNDANQLRLHLLIYAHQYSMIWYSIFQLGCLLLAITLAKCVLCWSISPRESIGYIIVGYLTCRINFNFSYYQNCKEIQTLMLCSYLAEWIIASCYCLLPGCCVQIVS